MTSYSLPPKKKSKAIKYGTRSEYIPVDQIEMVAPSGRNFFIDDTEVKMMKSLGWTEVENGNTV